MTQSKDDYPNYDTEESDNEGNDDFSHFNTPMGPPKPTTKSAKDKKKARVWREIRINCSTCGVSRRLTNERNPTGSLYDSENCVRCDELHKGKLDAISLAGGKIIKVEYFQLYFV